jgi:hypothetical protein
MDDRDYEKWNWALLSLQFMKELPNLDNHTRYSFNNPNMH